MCTPASSQVTELRYRYLAYGMTIHAEVELPELTPFESAVADLVFRRQDSHRPPLRAEQAIFEFDRPDVYLGFGGIGHFFLPQPGLVTFDPCPGADPALVNLVLLGVVMATVLHRRGLVTMHASGIDIGGRGVVFMGNKGAGKSTTAAAFIRAGHRLLTDDVMPIEAAADGSFQLLPGFPQLKLAEDASSHIVLPDSQTSPIGDTGFNKSRLRLTGRFSAQTVPPAVFYVLAVGKRCEAVPISGAAAMASLMANSYHARYGAQVFHGAVAAAQMQQCAALARTVPVRMLRVPRQLERLDEVVRFVERDVTLT